MENQETILPKENQETFLLGIAFDSNNFDDVYKYRIFYGFMPKCGRSLRLIITN